MSHSLQAHTPGKPKANQFPSKQGSNLHGETSLDFKSNALTTEPLLPPRGFPGGSDGKESTVWGNWVQSLGQEDPLEKGMATQSSILAWWASVHGVAKS